MGKINVEFLAADLRAIRNQRKNSRKHCVNLVLERLGYAYSKSVSIEQFDAILIRAIDQHLGKSIEADVLLMSFGLLQGYYYNNIKSIGARRVKYLTESNYLSADSPEGGPYIDATDELKGKLEERLRRAEDRLTESLAMFLSEQKIEDYIKENIAPTAIPQPSYILLAHGLEPALTDDDDGVLFPDTPPDDEEVAPDDELTGSGETSEQNELKEDLSADEPKAPPPDTPPEENPPPDESEVPPSDPPPNPQRTHIWQFSIGSIININKKSQVNANLSWVKNPIFSIVVIIVAVMACMRLFHPSAPPAEEPTIQNNVLIPGEIQQLIIVMPSGESVDELLEYITSDPSLITVSPSGFLMAHQGQPGETSRTAEIQVLGETGVIATESYTVDFTRESFDPPVDDINDFVPDFSVTQKIRIAGDTEWHNYVDAKVGDELEIQFEYRNISEAEHVNVAVKDILPTNLEYIAGSTTLYTVKTPEGASKGQDGLVGNGIYIGTYGSGSNAYIRFRVRVIDTNLADGVTSLVNWSQACVNGVTLQDFATVRVTKE